MSYMATIYADLIIKKFKSMNDVPSKDREKVKAVLIAKGRKELAVES